jgi:hypothetical protein
MRRINGASSVENLPEVLKKIYNQGKEEQGSEPKALGMLQKSPLFIFLIKNLPLLIVACSSKILKLVLAQRF